MSTTIEKEEIGSLGNIPATPAYAPSRPVETGWTAFPSSPLPPDPFLLMDHGRVLEHPREPSCEHARERFREHVENTRHAVAADGDGSKRRALVFHVEILFQISLRPIDGEN
jgi:hypothetical protein